MGGALLFCVLVALAHAEKMEQWEEEIGWLPGKFPNGMGPESEGPEWGATRPPWYPKEGEEPKDIVLPDIPLFPPRYHPGTVIEELEFSEIDKALDDVMRAGDLMHDRRCALSISNEGGAKLTRPSWYFSSGGTHSALYPDIEVGETSLNLFLKTPWALRGSVGVLTYDIEGTDFKLAVMWEVPFDRNIYDNLFNVKIYPKGFGTGKDMFNQMYKYAGPFYARTWEERTEYGVKLRGVMTDNVQSKVSVWIDSSDFQAEGDHEVWVDCSYHAGWFAKHCWKECTNSGWCWVRRKCSNQNDCFGIDQTIGCDSNCKGP